MALNTDPNRVLKTTAARVAVMPSPKDKGESIELRFVKHRPFMHCISLNGNGNQDIREPVDARQYASIQEWREYVYQWAIDSIEHLIRTPWPTEGREGVIDLDKVIDLTKGEVHAN